MADGDSEPSARYPAHLGAFFRNVLVTRFDTRAGRLAVAGLAVLVAVVAVNAGVASAFAVGLVIALGLALAIVALERDRWAAQDVILAFRGQRQAEWLRDTGTKGTNGSRAEAEVWLGAHRPGTVPPRYRAIIAEQTGDPVVLAREVAALPDATALDRANRAQLLRSWEWSSGATPDTTTFRAIIAELPDSVDRRMFETWLAQVEASERHRHGGRDWLGPLLAIRDVVPRAPLPLRWHLGVWLSRFAPVLGLVASSVVFSAIGLSLASAADAVPASYAETVLSIRGDLPSFDDEGVWRTLPRLARALPSATPVGDTPLGAAAVEDLIADGLPTIIWTVDGIEVAGPTALRGGRIHEIEVLLSRTRLGDDLAIVTLRGPNGPSYLFRVDSTVVATLRAAAGIRTPAASG